jgi:hypothetical protein
MKEPCTQNPHPTVILVRFEILRPPFVMQDSQNVGILNRICLDASHEKHKNFVVRCSLARGSKDREREVICLGPHARIAPKYGGNFPILQNSYETILQSKEL